jgi:hypothetical protein
MYYLVMSNQYYGGVIWTNHALMRLKERGVSRDQVLSAFNHPERTEKSSNNNSFQYQKRFGNSLVTVVAKQNEKNEWIFLSVWVDPPLPGSEDDKRRKGYQRYQKATFWNKIWITLMRQIGLSKY